MDPRTVWEAVRRCCAVTLALALALGVVLLERRHGLFGLIFAPDFERVLRPGNLVALGLLGVTLTRWPWLSHTAREMVSATGLRVSARVVDTLTLAVMGAGILVLTTLGRGPASPVYTFGLRGLHELGGVLAGGITALMAIRRWRGLSRPARVLVGALGVTTVLVVMAHAYYRAGSDFAAMVFVLLGLMALGWWAVQRYRPVAGLLGVCAAAGLVHLTVSGTLLLSPIGLVPFLALKNAHAIVGLWFVPIAGVSLMVHVTRADTTVPVTDRSAGLVAGVCLLALLVTAVSRVATGFGLPTNATSVHVGLAAAAITLGVFHRFTVARAVPSRARVTSVATTLLVLSVGALPALVTALRPRSSLDLHGEIPLSPRARQSLLANPRTGITASTLAGGGLPEDLLSVRARRPGCANAQACHVPETDQWQRSAHRFGANPAYQRVVRDLVTAEGIPSARLCASCHDPLPLLAGRMVTGEGYPRGGSEGVTCLVCHAARGALDVTPRDGRYRLAPLETLPHQLDVPAVQNFMVYDDLAMHRSFVATTDLRDDALCASCHRLSLQGVEIRDTFGEWQAAQARLPPAARGTCRSCHMRPLPEFTFGDRAPHEHTMLGGNVAVAPLAGDSPAARVRFMADALGLSVQARRTGRGDDGALALTVTLRNVRSGHDFPTAPRDLVQYWFEVRDGTGPGDAPAGRATWHRLGSGSLFPEVLTDGAGMALARHEIWRVAHRAGPDRIAPGEARAFDYTLAPDEALHGAVVEVRLIYQRYPDRLAAELRATGLRVEPVEILRQTAPVSDGDPPVPVRPPGR